MITLENAVLIHETEKAFKLKVWVTYTKTKDDGVRTTGKIDHDIWIPKAVTNDETGVYKTYADVVQREEEKLAAIHGYTICGISVIEE